jgi:MoxR-like ATPase
MPPLPDPGTAARAGAEEEVRERLPDVASLAAALDDVDYLADPGLATAMFLAVRLPQPLLLEGEPGVGKTEAAKALARTLDTPLYRLQCFEGIDAAEALYEWNHPRQLLGIRLAEARGAPLDEDDLFGADYLLRRPLLQAIEHPGPRPAVLLLDEIDRADAEFEAFLLEVLSDFQVSVPELGTIKAKHQPVVLLTSNNTRELSEALKRRCLYIHIDYPNLNAELQIVNLKVPGLPPRLAHQAVELVQRLRGLDLKKHPSVSETIDWARALVELNAKHLDRTTLDTTLSVLLKYESDLQKARRAIGREDRGRVN